MSPKPVATVIADRPLLWLIREPTTGAILFMGRVASPRDPRPAAGASIDKTR